MKKITRKEIAEMSTTEFVGSLREPYSRLFNYMKPYRGRFALGLFFSILFGVSQAFMFLGMRFVFSHVLPGAEPIQPPQMLEVFGITAEMFATPDSDGPTPLIGVILACAFVPFMMLIRGTFSYLSVYCMMWVGVRVLSDIRTELFHRLMIQSLDFFNKQKTGELIQTVFNQTRMAQTAITSILGDVIKHPISIIGVLALIFYLDWVFALCATVVFPLCLVPVIIIGNKVRTAGGKEEQEAGMLMVVMQEAFAGIRVVKSHGREDFEEERFNSANDKMMRFIMRWQKAMEIVGPIVETVASLGIAGALFYAWWSGMDTSEFLVLVMALIALYPSAKALSRVPVLAQKCLAATTKIFEMMDRPLAIADSPDAVTLQDCQGEIRFHGVAYSYSKGIPAVDEIDLHIEPGKTYALVGPSGAGKSTMLSLLLRFYDPRKGYITVDGHDIRRIKQVSLRDNIGIVNQDTFLFHDTIRANIQYGRTGATNEEVVAAAKKAHAHEFILAQQNGYDTVIGDKGCMLSGGQQQRLSIARAILRDAPILLLDEATSALDTESEQHIQAALDVLSSGKTVIAIAHRLSTILKADNIVVMDGGRIQDVGPHADLLVRSPLYQKLYNLQFHREEDGVPADEPAPEISETNFASR